MVGGQALASMARQIDKPRPLSPCLSLGQSEMSGTNGFLSIRAWPMLQRGQAPKLPT